MKYLFITASAVLLLAPLHAGEWRSKGETTAETRLFTDDDNPETIDFNLGLFARLETRRNKGPWSIQVRAFGRVDHEDSSRDLTAVEEAWFGYRKGPWDARLGYQLLNWTATEAFHPADIMNSRNLDSNIENPEKLGELMLSLRRRVREGGLTLYYLPRYEAPNLPGPSSRLRFGSASFPIGRPLWLEGDGAFSSNSYGAQWGARFNQTLGDADFSLHYLDHMDRQLPRFTVTEQGVLHPVYLQVKDLGATYLQLFGSLIFKLEYAYKDFADQTGANAALNQIDHHQVAFGLEYGWASQDGSETTLLLEGQSVLGTDQTERAGLTPFQRDILAGARYARNDALGRELLITTIFDVERSREALLNISYKQRLSDTWSIQTGLRWIDAPQKGDRPVGLENLDESNQVFVNLSRYF